MQVLVELDGVIFDVHAAYWDAYSRAVAAIGMARTDEATLWRLVRTGADDAKLVSGARPQKLEAFRAAFNEALESDEVLAKWVPHDDVRETIRVLRDLGMCVAVTTGSNLLARHRLVRENGLSDAYPRIEQVPSATMAATSKLQALRGEERLGVVFASSTELCKSADEAGLVPIGITSGPCIAKRLASAGARATYRDLTEFAEAHKKGDESLRRAGLIF